MRGVSGARGDTLGYWMVANAALAGVGVATAGGHPISILVGAVASPFTSLNPWLPDGSPTATLSIKCKTNWF